MERTTESVKRTTTEALAQILANEGVEYLLEFPSKTSFNNNTEERKDIQQIVVHQERTKFFRRHATNDGIQCLLKFPEEVEELENSTMSSTSSDPNPKIADVLLNVECSVINAGQEVHYVKA